jgi:GTPase SAR1 family protein
MMRASEAAVGAFEGVRRQAVGVLDELMARAGEFDVAEPPPALDGYREKLRQSAYKVLVVGEAKRGKSTFVNALIGRDILPTDVEVATSQVFSVRPSEREAYRVRYEDGSAREITPEEIPRYGSQVMADAGFVPDPGEIVRWIEVEVPIRFLPEGVSILDTPGLGSLHAGHARITHRFVPEADAVIFVLESGQPMVVDDVKFIEQILTVTNKIFFVQTKIDRYDREDWQSLQRRNEEILRERFGDRLTDTRVWPVSSTNLRKAASATGQAQEEAYLMVSRHNELTDALQAFLARVSGWGRAAEAMTVTASYHATCRQAIAGRLATLTAESKTQQEELQKVAVEAKRRFDAEWGVNGQKYRALRDGLKRATALGKQGFSNAVQPGCDLELAQKARINEIKSLKQANRVAEEMPGDVVTGFMNEWTRVCGEVERRCLLLLGPFVEDAEIVGAPLRLGAAGLLTGDKEDGFKRDYFGMVRGAAGGGMLVMGVSGMATLVAPSIAVTALASPVVPFLAAPALLVLLGGGVKGALDTQLKTAQQQLRGRLAEQLQKARRHFFDVHLTAGSYSRVDEHFAALDRVVDQHVRELVEKKSRESQAEISRLTESMKLGAADRQALTKKTQAQLASWDGIGKTIQTVRAQIQSHAPAAPSRV